MLQGLIKENQNKINQNIKIIISFGHFMDSEHILDRGITEEDTVKIIDFIVKEPFILFNTKLERIYKYHDMEYYIYKSDKIGNKIYDVNNSYNIIKCQNIIFKNNYGVRFKLLEIINRKIEEFPCKFNYLEIINRSRIILNYNKLFEIHLITDIIKDSTKTHKVELHIINHNINLHKMQSKINYIVENIINIINIINNDSI